MSSHELSEPFQFSDPDYDNTMNTPPPVLEHEEENQDVMDNVGQIICAALLKRLRRTFNGEEDLPEHDMEFSIPALLEGGTPQEIEEIINLCEVIAIREEQEHLQSIDKLVTCLLNSSIVEDSTEVPDKVIRLSAELCKGESVTKENDLLTYRANNYAVPLTRPYWQKGKPEDLDKAIALSKKAVDASSQATFIMNESRGTHPAAARARGPGFKHFGSQARGTPVTDRSFGIYRPIDFHNGESA